MAENNAKAASDAGTAAEKPKKDGAEAEAGPKLIMGMTVPVLALVALNFLVMSGGVGYIYYIRLVYKPPVITESVTKAEIKKTVEAEEKKRLGADGEFRLISLPEMNINLRSRVGGRNHYATVTIGLKCNNDACMQQVKTLRVKLEDAIQTLIASRSYAELTMSEASYRLKHEITKTVNSIIEEGTVTDTFFSDYTIQ